MQQKTIHKYALELLIETTVNHHKLRISYVLIEKICDSLNKQYASKEFTRLLEDKSVYYKNLLLNEDNSLFISTAHTPVLLKEGFLFNETDRFLVLIQLLYWIEQNNFANKEIYYKLIDFLVLPSDLTKQIEFLFEPIGQKKDYPNCYLLSSTHVKNDDLLEGNWIESNNPVSDESIFPNTPLSKLLRVAYFHNYNCFVLMAEDKMCILCQGESTNFNGNRLITYQELKQNLINNNLANTYKIIVDDLSFWNNSRTVLHTLNFQIQSGEIVGIVGREGTGKTCLLSLLSGTLKPSKGKVSINGYNVIKSAYQTGSIIGFVPEEDLLIRELTVYENLYYTYKLHTNLSKRIEITYAIKKLLVLFEIEEIIHKRVGATTDKYIQPGQRRLLNIAIEFIREPDILLVDNATNNLNMTDASFVLKILSKLSFKGLLVVSTITQTSLNAFECFDKILVLDEGGYPVYFGRNEDFKHTMNSCFPNGILNNYLDIAKTGPEDIFNILELKSVKINDKNIRERIVSPLELHKNHTNSATQIEKAFSNKLNLPGKITQQALDKQYISYLYRNIKSKLANKKDLLIPLIASPSIALLFGFIFRVVPDTQYQFSSNLGIPHLFYLNILCCFFFGLIAGARELVRNKRLLKKELHLGLSFFSFINSKLTFLLLLLLAQVCIYTLIINTIVQINGLFWGHLLIYFSIAACGVLLGLLYSYLIKVYENVILILVPSTLLICTILGGGWIGYDLLLKQSTGNAPVITNFIPTRYAYEAILVHQYKKNNYGKIFYEIDRDIHTNNLIINTIIPTLKRDLETCIHKQSDSLTILRSAISDELNTLAIQHKLFRFEYLSELKDSVISLATYEETFEYLNYLDYSFSNKLMVAKADKQKLSDSLDQIHGDGYVRDVLEKSRNIGVIAELTTPETSVRFNWPTSEYKVKSSPVLQHVNEHNRRNMYLSPEKAFNAQIVSTFEYNLSIIWLMNLIVYLVLLVVPYPTIYHN